MPYSSEKILIAGTKHDGRSKLSIEQKQAIKILHNEGYSLRKLAEMFGVSKWSVQSIISPSPRKRPKKYSTEYWTEAKRKYRKKKQDLYKSGQLNKIRSKHQSNKPP